MVTPASACCGPLGRLTHVGCYFAHALCARAYFPLARHFHAGQSLVSPALFSGGKPRQLLLNSLSAAFNR